MPEQWWEDYCQNSNGYFGSAEEVDKEGNLGHSMLNPQLNSARHANTLVDTWAYFESKQLPKKVDSEPVYEWFKLNVFTRWITKTKQTVIILFDIKSPSLERIRNSLKGIQLDHLGDPFWAYTKVTNELVRLKDDAVWAIRNHVRAIEKEKIPDGKPEPNYRRFHDVDRHAIHVTESIEVSMQTLDSILQHHHSVAGDVQNPRLWRDVHQKLAFSKSMISSLRHRSVANEKRLQNEIQLAFNVVAQYDSGVGVQIGKATREDSSAMKTISLVTLAFFPPTFICAIFSTTFFNYEASSGWSMSGQFWIYWVFAIPTTIITSVLCYYWQKMSSRAALLMSHDSDDSQVSLNQRSNSIFKQKKTLSLRKGSLPV